MENLGIDYKLLIAQIVNFLLFFFIFKKYIAKPFFQFLQAEKKKEQEKETILQKAAKMEEENALREKEWKTAARKDKEKMMEDVKEQGTKVKEEMMVQAKKEAVEYVEKAKKQIQEERMALNKEMKERTLDLSLYLVDKALKNYLTDDVKKGLTEYILKNSSKDIGKI